MKSRLKFLLDNFKGKKILVIGDVMLDSFVYGNVSRISPEAPIPIVNIEKKIYSIGGTGNLASNVKTLGGEVFLFGFIGKDTEGELIKKLLEELKIEYFFDECTVTTFKERIIGNGQQIVRIDKEEKYEKSLSDNFKEMLLMKADEAEIIILSDYEKGAITKELVELLDNHKHKIIVGPKPKNKYLYKGVKLIVPNKKEAFDMSMSSEVKEALYKLREDLDSNVIITLGSEGMIVYSDKVLNIPTYAREVYDIGGASDTTIAALGLALASGASLEEAAIIANHAAGIAVQRKGTYSVMLSELEKQIESDEGKVLNFEELKKVMIDKKLKGKKIVWTNGCFDILHTGHIDYLRRAKKLGDVLVVGLDSDESVKKLKGPLRPINCEGDRAEILSALEFVDCIIIFPFGSVKDYLKELKPDVYVKGGDYTIDTINQEERRVVEGYNGKIAILDHVPNKSTTNTIEKIKEAEKK
ncbi:MAG: bifunctional heptose 7-phosphate kinase/heptose 1-phosphate adenyltransferase [Nanoarchaeota archaeon]|nr:bifunctional heptose 7-phosphate kinase/heptose 1-phosphate adenyltransferase [Nanoarchaeota archaeon]